MDMGSKLTQLGKDALEAGDRTKARQLFAMALRQNPKDEQAWLLMADLVETPGQRIECLKRVLAINPHNAAARAGLTALKIPGSPDPDFSGILANLTEAQKEAVLHRGNPLLIIAGPGSGKTEVIARRVAYLVRSRAVAPHNLLAVTFTNKAALGLKDRIQQKLPEVNAELMQISTIHSFCADLLRRYSAQSSLPHGFRILDEAGQFLFVYSHRKDLGLGEIVKGRAHDFFDAILGTFNLATEELVEADRLASWCEETGACSDEKEAELWKELHIIANAYRQYGEMLHQSNLVDFAYLQRYALDLLQNHPAIVAELRTTYPEILVDEYQDTNAAQERLLGLLAGVGQRLTVVGDDDQSIYRFRGATVRNILGFPERYPGAHLVRLEQNFRSHRQIVDQSHQVIVNNPRRYPKDLQAARGIGNEVLLVYERTATEEAEAVVQLLQRLHQAGRIRSYGDVVILLRSVRSYAEQYVSALANHNIPVLVVGDASLFEQNEIRQLYDLFNFLGTTRDWGDKYLRQPLVGLSEPTNQALKSYTSSLIEITDEAALQAVGIGNKADCRHILRLLELKRKVLAQQHSSALQIFYDLLAAIGCVARFEVSGDSLALTNLGIVSRLVAAWDEYGSTNNFYPFREYLGLLREGGVDPAIPALEHAVRIMTIHQAKGAEFPVVVLGAAMDGRLPTARRKDPYEIPYHLRASQYPEVDDPHLVDERKLYYVAATRARDLLIVGTADVVTKRGGGPSPFVHEMFGADLRAAVVHSEEQIREIESRPGLDQGPRPRHSFSQLAYYIQCPMRYKFAVVYGMEIPWLDPVDFGANVHRCLQAIHQRAIQNIFVKEADLPALVDENWLSTTRSQPKQEEAFKRAALKQLERYLAGYTGQLAAVRQAETHFSAVLQDDVLVGKIDLVRSVGQQGDEIVDFKTSASGPEEIAQAELQLSLYALGMDASLQQPVVRCTAHFLGDGHVSSGEWNGERKATAQARLASLFEHIRQQEFPARRSYCIKCQEFSSICPYAPG
jgi:DNA helicase-2/ATP-dependent DNA helicase PcrA